MRSTVSLFILLGVIVLFFQNCAESQFSSAESKLQSSVSDTVVAIPVVEEDDGVPKTDNSNPATGIVSKMFTVAPEGRKLEIPFDHTGLSISKIVATHAESGASNEVHGITFPYLRLEDEGIYEITMSNGSRYDLHLGVIPNIAMTFQSDVYTIDADSEVQMTVDFNIPQLPIFMKSASSQILNSFLSNYDVKWFYINSQGRSEVASTEFEVTPNGVDQYNRIQGSSVLKLDSVSLEQEGQYEVIITSQIGDVVQDLSKNTSLIVSVSNPGSEVPRDCNISGSVIAHGSSQYFYNASSATSCSGQSRACNDGSLGGDSSYSFANCTPVAVPMRNCSAGGVSVAHGSSRYFYNASSATSCSGRNRACNDGSLGGSSSYSYASCTTVAAPMRNCSAGGVSVAHGSSRYFYNASSATSCSGQNRACNDGSLGGSSSYSYASCTTVAAPMRSCSAGGVSVAHGSSRTFYSSAVSSNCSGQTRVCNDGTLSGSYTVSSCQAPTYTWTWMMPQSPTLAGSASTALAPGVQSGSQSSGGTCSSPGAISGSCSLAPMSSCQNTPFENGDGGGPSCFICQYWRCSE